MIADVIRQKGALMKRQLIAGFALGLLAVVPAMAADMRAAPILTKAPMMAPVFSWTGCYIDAGVGYGMWNQDHSTTTTIGGVPNIDTVENTGGGRGWATADAIDISKLPTLPELIVGRAEGRKSDAEVTCFLNNIGLGYQFAAAGALLYRKAKESGAGHDLPTDWFTEDVHP